MIRHNVQRVPPTDRREIAATMVDALNKIGRAMDESRAAIASGDLDLVRQYARVIIDQASTIGTVGLP